MPTKGKYGARLRQCFLPGHVLQCTVVQYRATQHPTSGFLRKIRERDTRDPFTHAAAAHGRTSNILACKRGGFDLFCLLCLCLSKLLFAGVAYCLRTRLNISMTSSHPNMHTRVNKRFARSSEEGTEIIYIFCCSPLGLCITAAATAAAAATSAANIVRL